MTNQYFNFKCVSPKMKEAVEEIESAFVPFMKLLERKAGDNELSKRGKELVRDGVRLINSSICLKGVRHR